MSGEAFGWARKAPCTGRDARGAQVCLPLAANAVLLLMADYAGRKNDLDPSVETMASELGCTARTVQRAIASLLADGFIEREFRTTPKGKTTSSRYVLRLDRKKPVGEGREGGDDAAEGCLTVTPRGDTQSPSGVTDSHHEGDTQSPSTTFEPRTLSRESADALSSARAHRLFEEVSLLWAQVAPDRVAPPKDWAAWLKALAKVDAETLAAAARRYLETSDDVRRGRCKAFAVWLSEERWVGWLAAAQSAGASPEPPPWPPAGWAFADWRGVGAAFVAAVEAKMPASWIEAWLGGAGWDAARARLVTRTATAASRVARELRRELAAYDVDGVEPWRAEMAGG